MSKRSIIAVLTGAAITILLAACSTPATPAPTATTAAMPMETQSGMDMGQMAIT